MQISRRPLWKGQSLILTPFRSRILGHIRRPLLSRPPWFSKLLALQKKSGKTPGKSQTGPLNSASPLSENSTLETAFDPFPISGHVRPRQGTEICNFGAPSPLEALHWIFCFFSSIYVQFSKTSPLKSGERSEKSGGENRVKSCHVCGCHGFFGPDYRCISMVLSVYTKSDPLTLPQKCSQKCTLQCLDGRNRAIVIAEALARVIAAIRITSVRWRSYLPLKTQNLVLVDPAFVALRFESLDWRSLVQYSFHVELQNGLRELTAFAERWRLAVGDFAHLSCSTCVAVHES